MEAYKKLAEHLIDEHVADTKAYEADKPRRVILEELLEDTQDVFGNMSGSRTMSTEKAKQFITESGAVFDDEIAELYQELGESYFADTLKRGAETFDVVTLELVAPQVINEMLEAEALNRVIQW